MTLNIMFLITGLCVGLFLGVWIERFLYPYLDTLFNMFTIRQSEIASEINLNIEMMKCECVRQYPELDKDNAILEQTNAIGFHYSPPDDEYYEEEIEE